MSDFQSAYTTGQITKYFFGVSITTIDNRIKVGRLEDVERTEKMHKHDSIKK